jgi:hypothetical protein
MAKNWFSRSFPLKKVLGPVEAAVAGENRDRKGDADAKMMATLHTLPFGRVRT